MFIIYHLTSHSPTQRPLSAHHCVLVGQRRSHVRPGRGGLLTSTCTSGDLAANLLNIEEKSLRNKSVRRYS